MRSTLDPAALWDNYRPTTLLELSDLARQLNVGRVFAKLENERPLGNFKAVGGMTAGLKALAGRPVATPAPPAPLPMLICASEGNHGLAVAAAAARAGTKATVFLPSNANPIRADRIKAIGGEIYWIDGTYDDAVEAAAAAAARGEGLLIPDTSPDPNDPVVKDVMTGYGLITQELRDQLPVRPTHLFVQAGVGGLAAAVVDGLHDFMSAPHRILIVEPESAACVSQPHPSISSRMPSRILVSLSMQRMRNPFSGWAVRSTGTTAVAASALFEISSGMRMRNSVPLPCVE